MPIIASPYGLFQHATTTKVLIKAALRKIGALGAGEEVEAAELQDALDEMNRMLDTWNTQRLTVSVLNRTEWTLSTVGTDSVEIGGGGQIDTTRPNRIEPGEAYIRETGLVPEYPLDVWTRDKWAAITDKTVSGRPQVLYYEASAPFGAIRLWPKTDKQYDLILYGWNLLSQVSNVEQTLALLPAYSDAIVHELAIRLAPEYGKVPSATLVASMLEAKAGLKRINKVTPELRVDEALTRPALGGSHGYNIFSDG